MVKARNLTCTYFEASHHKWYDDITFLLSHLLGNGQQHQHIITLRDSHGIQVTQNIGTGNLALLATVAYTNTVRHYMLGYLYLPVLHFCKIEYLVPPFSLSEYQNQLKPRFSELSVLIKVKINIYTSIPNGTKYIS